MKSASMELGPVGIWTGQLEYQPGAKAQEAAAELERLGFGSIWFPESVGREALTQAGLLLAGTRRIIVATGIANIYGRDPMAMAAAQKTLAEAYPGRFLLGLGVSHSPLVERRGHRYEKPVPAMRAYLEAMDGAPYSAVPPPTTPRRVLAALGPKMLQLAAERAAGAHPYKVTPEHTAQARAILGAGPLLLPEQAVVLETTPTRARDIARSHLSFYLTLPNYANQFRRLGFGDADFTSGGSDRLVDAIVAWGGMSAIIDRVRAHQAAGADHVCLQVLTADPRMLPWPQWRELASVFRPSALA
jgi:probable F420-dependent oxidoreductase